MKKGNILGIFARLIIVVHLTQLNMYYYINVLKVIILVFFIFCVFHFIFFAQEK